MQVLKSRIKVPTATELLLPPGLGGARYRIILLEETVRYRRLSRVTKQTIKGECAFLCSWSTLWRLDLKAQTYLPLNYNAPTPK